MTKEELLRELKNCRNELCLRCGKYRDYPDYCDECRWNDENMSKWEEAENETN